MSSILALDYGRRRIGVAVSDALGLTAQPVGTWSNLKWENIVEKIRTWIQDKEVESVIVGFPLNLRGEKGHLAREVERFVNRLKQHISIPIILWDERYTSLQAERILRYMNEKPSQKKERVDLIASVLLLQNYLDYQKGASIRNQGEEN